MKGQVYNLARVQEAPPLTETQQPFSRESRVSHLDAVRVEEEVQNRTPTAEEMELQAQYIQAQRALEDYAEKRPRLQQHHNNEARVRLTTAGVCASLHVERPPPKRMRTNGQGREEAVVLTSDEQRSAAKARLLRRQQQGDMQKGINAAKQHNRAADRAFLADLKRIEALIAKVQKEGEKLGCANAKHVFLKRRFRSKKHVFFLKQSAFRTTQVRRLSVQKGRLLAAYLWATRSQLL